MSKKPRLTISLPPHIKEQVEQDAKHDRMPMSEVIDRILWQYYGPPNRKREENDSSRTDSGTPKLSA